MTNHISEGSPRRPVRPMRCRKPETVNGASIWNARSSCHLLLGALAVRSGEIAVVNEEAVGLVIDLAVLPQALAHRLAFLAGVCEHEALFAPGMLEDIADAGIGGLGRGVRGRFQRRGVLHGSSALVRLRRGVVKVLHAEPPDLFAAVELRDDRAATAARREKLPGKLRVSDGCRESDPARVAAGELTQPLNEAEGLQAPIRPQQGVDLVDDDEPQVAEQGRNLPMLVNHQRFQRLGRDLQDAGGLFEKLSLSRLRGVPVPARDGDAFLLAKLV